MDVVYTLDETEQIVQALWQEGQQKLVWAFYAPMGAGKTTLIHSLCNFLKVEGAVSSPTYAIINEYKSAVAGVVLHMDWYRLKDEEDAINTGVEDALLSGNLCLVEWPEKAEMLLPTNYFSITIELVNATTRRIYTAIQ